MARTYFFSLLVATLMATTAAAESGEMWASRTSGTTAEPTCSLTAWPEAPAWPAPADAKYPAWPAWPAL